MTINFSYFVLLVTCALFVLGGEMRGQSSSFVAKISDYTYIDGLSNNHVYYTFKDSRGIIWISRENGLDRFDGKLFKKISYPAFTGQHISEFLLEDDAHNLWVKHNWQLYLLNIYTEELVSSADYFGVGFPKNVLSAVKGLNGSVLIQTSLDTIMRFKPGESLSLVFASPGSIVAPLVELEDGTLWLERNDHAKGGAMLALGASGEIILNLPYTCPHIYAKGVWGKDTIHFMTPDSLYLVNSQGIQLQKAIKDLLPSFKYSDPYNTGQFPGFYAEPNRPFVWFWWNAQMVILDKKLNLLFDFDEAKKGGKLVSAFSLLVDNQNIAWVSSTEGLKKVRFSANPFRLFLTSSSSDTPESQLNSCRGMTQAIDGNIYILSSPNIYRLNQVTATCELFWKASNVEIALRSLEADSMGNLWFYSKKLTKLNIFTKEIKEFKHPKHHNWIIKKVGNQLWSALPFAWHDMTTGNFHAFEQWNSFEDLKNSYIYLIEEKSPQELWILASNGLYVLDKNAGITERYWKNGHGKYYFPAEDLRHYCVDSDGSWWIATREGLLHWDEKRGITELYSELSGVPTYCHAVFPDSQGFLWLSSDFGLVRFDKKTKVARLFYEEDGLSSNEFNRISYFMAPDSTLYFGGLNGFISFNPTLINKSLENDNPEVKLVLTECYLFSGDTKREENYRARVISGNRLDIEPGDGFLRLQFALTDYRSPYQTNFKYRIKGFEEDWHSTTKNELLLSGLPFGDFVLEVMAIQASEEEESKVLRIPIRVLRPFYLQAWFLTMAFFALISTIVFYVKRRTNSLKNNAALLEKVVKERTETVEKQQIKLQYLYDQKSKIYANITHEFRTPLTLILGPANQILESAQTLQAPEIVSKAEHIVVHGERMLSLVNQMLNLNKLEAKAMHPEYQQADIIPFFQQIVNYFQFYTEEKGITLLFNSELDTLLMDFDAEKLEAIFKNLLFNAIKFTEPKGQISLSIHPKDLWLCITVSDTGKGIENQHLPNIFERFYQADNSQSRSTEGTGLGLALVKEFVELLGGTITVSSKLGEGSSFEVQLPITNHAAPGGIKTIEPPRVFSTNSTWNNVGQEESEKVQSGSVLIIEDNESIANYVASCLEKNYQVSINIESKKGLENAQEQTPDIIICDIMMPDMDGYEVCKILKSDPRTSHIPIVFLTALEEQMNRLERLNAGADGYLSKPFKAEELLGLVGKILHQREQLREKYLTAKQDSVKSNPVEESALSTPELKLLFQLQDAIKEDLDNSNMDIARLCQKMKLSQSQLNRKIQSLTGMSIGRYISYIRLKEAKELLDDSTLSIAEVAFKTGFSDPAYFSRLFAKTYGVSPRAYRSRME